MSKTKNGLFALALFGVAACDTWAVTPSGSIIDFSSLSENMQTPDGCDERSTAINLEKAVQGELRFKYLVCPEPGVKDKSMTFEEGVFDNWSTVRATVTRRFAASNFGAPAGGSVVEFGTIRIKQHNGSAFLLAGEALPESCGFKRLSRMSFSRKSGLNGEVTDLVPEVYQIQYSPRNVIEGETVQQNKRPDCGQNGIYLTMNSVLVHFRPTEKTINLASLEFIPN